MMSIVHYSNYLVENSLKGKEEHVGKIFAASLVTTYVVSQLTSIAVNSTANFLLNKISNIFFENQKNESPVIREVSIFLGSTVSYSVRMTGIFLIIVGFSNFYKKQIII